MKLLLTMNLPYFPAQGGANKGNRYLLEGLVGRGHSTRAVVSALGTPSRLTHEQFLAELAAQGVRVSHENSIDVFSLNGVEIHAAVEPSRLRAHLVKQIREFDPDWTLVSSEDPSLNLLDAAVKACPGRVVYLARTTSFLPFGPQAFFPNFNRAKLLDQTTIIIALSQFVADYIRQWGRLESTVVPLSFFGSGPFPHHGNFDRGYVTMINPCAIKGITIFLELAKTFPEVQFAAVPTWGTTEADLAALEPLPNVRLLPPTEDIDQIFAQTRILLMPSLWAEARGRVVVEAMLRGIPVMASNIGGIPEAKLGTDYLLPVRHIEGFTQRLDANFIPVSAVPEQDLKPWCDALTELLSDRCLYERQSKAAREVSLEYVSGLSVAPLEDLLARRLSHPELNGRSAAEARSPLRDGEMNSLATEMGSVVAEIARLTPQQRALLSLQLKKKAAAEPNKKPHALPITPAPRSGSLPLSFAQQRLWFIDQLAPGSSAYNMPDAARLSGIINIDVVKRAINEIVRRHETLRATFTTLDGQPVQVIAPTATLSVPVIDLGHLDAALQQQEIERMALEEARRPFNLQRGPLCRITLLGLGELEHVALLTMHHIISDGWSMKVFLGELVALYGAFSQGRPSPLPELPIQYVDYAIWQRQWLKGEVLQNQLSYWKKQLAGAPPVLELPTDRPRPTTRGLRGARQHFALSRPLSESLKTSSRNQEATLFITLLAAFKALLYRYSGQEEIVVGTPIAGRNRVETEAMIGLFINTLALRTSLSSELSFHQLLDRVREVALGAYANQDVPFEKLVEELEPERKQGYSPLFQVMFRLDNGALPVPPTLGLVARPLPVDNGAVNFDLALMMEEGPQGIFGCLTYNTDLFEERTIRRMLQHFETLLAGAVARPDTPICALPMLSEQEREQLLMEWNQTRVKYPETDSLRRLIEQQVERSPEAVAVVFEGQQLKYRELNARANQLAHYLGAQAVGPEVPVAVCMHRSLEMVVALLGVLKAGGAYLPLDPDYPADRLSFTLDDAQAPVVLTQARLSGLLPPERGQILCLDREWESRIAPMPMTNPESGVCPENAAYLIYTSGSTGRPKGAINTHAGICNRLRWMQEAYGLNQTDCVLQKTPYSFDVSVWEFFWPLMTGARMVIARPGGHRENPYLVNLIAEQSVTVTHFVPSMLSLFLEEEDLERCAGLRLVISSGEALSAELQERCWSRLGAELHNLYGPTEASVDVSSWACRRGEKRGSVPIGHPISNLELYVLDPRGEPTPVGVAGELHIGGVGLGRGYLKRPDLTAEKFVPHPYCRHAGARLYRTGDLARRLPDGAIEYLGRIDHQVKLHGLRIELGEIESVLEQHPGIQDSVVIVREDHPGDQRLVAYVACESRQGPGEQEMRSRLKQRLPEYMIPSSFVTLDELPLTPNGKLDRRALPAPDRYAENARLTFTAPRNETEFQLTLLWEELLGVAPIGVKDDFFVLGGHSMLAIQLIARIQKLRGKSLPLAALFADPTIEHLAELLRQETLSEPSPSLVGIRAKGAKRPFFCAPPTSGNAQCYYELARHMDPERPVYGLQSPGLDGRQNLLKDYETIVDHFINEIRSVQSEGPYLLGGYSMGGSVAYEMARQLRRQGQMVSLVALIDSYPNTVDEAALVKDDAELLFELFANNGITLSLDYLRRLSPEERLVFIKQQGERANLFPPGVELDEMRRHFNCFKANYIAAESYQPGPYSGRVVLLRSSERAAITPVPGWEKLVDGRFDIHTAPGTHETMVKAPHVRALAELITICLDEAESSIDDI
jgi:amino acid adenylation domain-containing protein